MMTLAFLAQVQVSTKCYIMATKTFCSGSGDYYYDYSGSGDYYYDYSGSGDYFYSGSGSGRVWIKIDNVLGIICRFWNG